MGIVLKTDRGCTLAQIKGDLDHHSAKFLRSEIDRELTAKRPSRLVIDFSGVTFMDSSGIGLIMGRYKLMQDIGGDIIVASPPSYIKKVIRLAGIDRLAKISDSLKNVLPKDFGSTFSEYAGEEEKADETVKAADK